jgi:hypothetical protein
MSVNNEIKRTHGSTETRVKKDMKKSPGLPPSNLDAPRAPAGYKHRWLEQKQVVS